MAKYPGYLPWYLGGDPYFTWAEVRYIVDDLKEQAKRAKEEEAQARRGKNKGRRR